MCVRPQEVIDSGANSAKWKSPVSCPRSPSSVSFPQLLITALVRGSTWVTFKEQQISGDYEFMDKSTRFQKDLPSVWL